MIRIILVLVVCAFGQGATSRQVILPSGDPGYSIRCDNMNINACYEKAGDVCHRGYDVQSVAKEQGFETGSSAYVVPGIIKGTQVASSTSSGTTTSEKGILIQCKEQWLTEKERAESRKAETEKRVALQEERSRQEREGGKRILLGVGILLVFVLTAGAIGSIAN